jgi:hypothetical protein
VEDIMLKKTRRGARIRLAALACAAAAAVGALVAVAGVAPFHSMPAIHLADLDTSP